MNDKKHLVNEARGIYSHVDQQGRKTYYIRYQHRGQQYWEAAGSSLTLAKKALAIRKAEIAQGKWEIHKVKPHTFETLLDKYQEYIQANNLLGNGYDSTIKNIRAFFAGKQVSEITPFLIEKYKLARQKANRVLYKVNRREESKRLVSPATVNRELSALSKMFAIAVQEKWIPLNPVKGVPRLRENNRMERILMPEEEERLLMACEKTKAPHLRAVVTIALYTGCRLSEILRLRWEQVDFHKDWITLVRTKSGRMRRVDINSKLREVFLGLVGKTESEYVFPSKLRKDKNLNCVKKAFASACQGAGIKGLRFHDLRHTWTTRMLEKGNSPAVVRDLGGWSDLSILNRYAHSTAEARKQAVESLLSDAKPEKKPEENCEQTVNENLFVIGRNRKPLKTKSQR